ncbi:cobalamin biosynthesis protein [Skermanella sp. TT6]|nr:CobD/CbiB family cobalamin biosynthesis protein [Skermanella sp. TT6]
MPFPTFGPMPGGAESLLLLPIALALAALAGDWPAVDGVLGLPRRLALNSAGWLDRRLNRLNRSPRTRLVRGLLVTVLFAVLALAAGLALTVALRPLPYGYAVELALVAGALQVRRPWNRLRTTMRALEWKGLPAGRDAVRDLTDRHALGLDEHGVVRAAVEGAARALDGRVVAPAFWYALAGLPGILLWTAVDALDRAIGDRGPRHDRFGLATARLRAALGWVPTRLTGLLLVLACPFVPRTRTGEAARTLALAAPAPVAAIAGALDLSLGGPRREGEVMVRAPWIGEGRARAVPADIRPALALYAVACLLLAGLAAAAAAAAALHSF